MEPFCVEGQRNNFDSQKWAPWTSKKVSRGGTWENNATGVERGKMGYSHEGRTCTHILNRICFSRIVQTTITKDLPQKGAMFGSTFAGYACQ